MWTLETKKEGINKLLKPYQLHVLTCLERTFDPGHKWGTRELWESSNENGVKISRASVINFVQALAKDGLIDREKTSGKGGYTFLYYTNKSRKEIENHILKRLLENINEIFERPIITALIETVTNQPLAWD